MTFVVRPMSSLLIMRRLHLIISLRSVELPNGSARRRDRLLEWTLGLFIPIVVAGPVYYTIQWGRFVIEEGTGCTDGIHYSILTALLYNGLPIIPPLLSAILYYPKVAKTLYQHNKEFNDFMRSNRSITHTNFIRVLALASIDMFLALFLNVMVFVSFIEQSYDPRPSDWPFYPGWNTVHADWSPLLTTWEQVEALGTWSVAYAYLTRWAPLAISFSIFALLGTTASARATYLQIFYTVAGWFGWKPTWCGWRGGTRPVLSSIGFTPNGPPQDIFTSLASAELGSLPSAIGIAPSLTETANLNSKDQHEDVTLEIGEPGTPKSCSAGETREKRLESSEPSAETIDIGEVSLSRSGSVMTV
ncbi:hypothetical protein PENSPDRAFT_650108 [Peniophora sp. CONT]|nr:hypothetical protein PENSPDRAFT_650108 [Peniophora sp. CONT]